MVRELQRQNESRVLLLVVCNREKCTLAEEEIELDIVPKVDDAGCCESLAGSMG